MDSSNRLTIPWPTEQGPLPFDCLVAICKFLQPEDLVRFALASRVRAKHHSILEALLPMIYTFRSSIMLLVPAVCGGALYTRDMCTPCSENTLNTE